MEYKDLIESKNSVRDYKEKEVDAATVKKIRDFAQSCERLDDSIGIDIRFMDNDTVYRQLDGYAGYKGILINAPHYMIVLSEKRIIILKMADMWVNLSLLKLILWEWIPAGLPSKTAVQSLKS